MVQFSVKRQAHWMNSSWLYCRQAMMLSSWMQYIGRMSSMPSKLSLWSFGSMACICEP